VAEAGNFRLIRLIRPNLRKKIPRFWESV